MVGLIEGIAETAANLLEHQAGRLAERARNSRGLVLAGYGRSSLARPAIGLCAVWALVIGLLAAADAGASRILYLAREELLCDTERDVCVLGTLSYATNDRLLWLSGRLRSATGPGMLQIILRGTTRQGFVRYAPMEITLRGNATEIVDFRMIPDYPDVANWQIHRITFVPDETR